MSTVTHINQHSATQVYETLLASLGTANVPHQWQIFMRSVRAELPEIFSGGRTKAAVFEKTAIGALGFTSWKQFCNASVEEGGLNLTHSTYRQWARAFTPIRDLDTYKEAPYSANEINSMVQYCNKAEIDFPSTPEAFEQLKEKKADDKARERAESMTGLKEKNAQLIEENGALTESLIRTNDELSDTQNRLHLVEQQIREADQKIGQLEVIQDQKDQKISEHEASISAAKQQLQKARVSLKKQQSLGFLGHLKAAFGLS